MASWSDNRPKAENAVSIDKLQENIYQINLVLTKLSKDEDLRDDLTLPEVKRALNHWTGRERLAPEEASHLQDSRRVVYVLQRLQMLQAVCQAARTKVPFDLFMEGIPKMPESMVKAYMKANDVDMDAEERKAQPKTQPTTIKVNKPEPTKENNSTKEVKKSNKQTENVSKIDSEEDLDEVFRKAQEEDMKSGNSEDKKNRPPLPRIRFASHDGEVSSSPKYSYCMWLPMIGVVIAMLVVIVAVKYSNAFKL